jgi:hypothetical protein
LPVVKSALKDEKDYEPRDAEVPRILVKVTSARKKDLYGGV